MQLQPAAADRDPQVRAESHIVWTLLPALTAETPPPLCAVHSIKQPFDHAFAPALVALQVSLYDVTPSMCVGDLTKILDDFGRRR